MMSDFSKTAPPAPGYEAGMEGEHLLLLDRPPPHRAPDAAPRFERSAAPFGVSVVPVFAALARHVDSVCVLEGHAADATRPPALDVLPGTTATLCITYGPRVEHAGQTAPSTLSGLFSTTRSYKPMPGIGVVMVTFKPGALRRFVGAPADAFAEKNVAAVDLWGSAVASLEDCVASAPDAGTRGALVQRFLVQRLVCTGWDPLAARIAHAIVDAGGGVSVRAIAAEAGLSERQLERRFSAAVGLRPKRFARLARFARAISLARTGISWAQVACASGFSDQSHLTHEFLALVGVPPESFARLCRVPTSSER